MAIVQVIEDQNYSPLPGDKDKKLSRKKAPQIFAAFAANLGALALGTALSWTSPALPSLRNDSYFDKQLTLDKESWIGSTVPLGAALGGPISSIIMETLGRKSCLILLTLPFIMAWVSIFFATTINIIIVGRFITGICSGGFTIVCPIFVAEVSDAEERGLLEGGFEILESVGILAIFTIGTFLPWRLQAITVCSIPTLMLILLLFIPESPRYLLSKGNRIGAAKALAWYRGAINQNDIEDELQNLEFEIKNTTKHKEPNYSTSFTRHFKTMISSCSLRQLIEFPTIKPVSIAFFLIVFNEVSGIDIIKFYTVDLFNSAGVSIDSYYSTIALGVVQLVGAIVAAIFVDKHGRRTLLLLSEIFIISSLGTLTTFFIVKKYDETFTLNYLQWVPLLTLVVYIFAFVIGLGTVTHMMMGEILPPHVKGLASSFITITEWILGFAITKCFESWIINMGDEIVFGLFTGLSCLGLAYIYYFVPETSGKTLEEIQGAFGINTKILFEDVENNKILLLSSDSPRDIESKYLEDDDNTDSNLSLLDKEVKLKTDKVKYYGTVSLIK